MRFRLAPNLSTLDDLDQPKRPTRQSEQKFRRPPEKFQRSISLAGKCRSGDLCSRNIKYMRMFVGVSSERAIM